LPADLSPLPCLYSNNSIENCRKVTPATSNESEKVETIAALTTVLSPYHKKAAQTLFLNVQRLVNEVPDIGHIAFLTLTFKDNVTDHKEASRRYNSWNTNFFSKHPAFGNYINTKEVQVRGAWHFHILVQLKGNIREGFDFAAYKTWLEGNNRFNKQCPTGNAFLKTLWADFRENLEQYGLGKIHSLEPIESTAEAIGRYVGKYISKHIGNRSEDQKGVRLVNYSRGWLRNSVKFAWNTQGAQEWRRKLAKFAMSLGCSELYQLSEKLGSGWAYKYLDDIDSIDQTSLERIINDLTENYERIVHEFESNTVKKIILARKKKEIAKSKPSFNENKWLFGERKKKESKEYMGKLTQGYIDQFVSEQERLCSMDTEIRKTAEILENYHMKKRSAQDLLSGESHIDVKTGEIVPF